MYYYPYNPSLMREALIGMIVIIVITTIIAMVMEIWRR